MVRSRITATHLAPRIGARSDGVWITGGASAVLVLFTIGFFEPLFARMAHEEDYPVHLQMADVLLRTGVRQVPHFLYHELILAVHRLLPGTSLETSALFVTTAAQVASALIIYFLIRSQIDREAPILEAAIVPLLLTIAVLVSGPVLLTSTVGVPVYLIGYFPPNAYHSPTTVLAKPFALALFAFTVQAFSPRARGRLLLVVGAASAVMLSALAKPSYLIALLPAVAVYSWVEWRRDRRLPWAVLIGGLLLPALLVLGQQFYFTYGSADIRAGVVLAPLRVIGYLDTKNPLVLSLKLLASVTFPLVVTAVLWPRTRTSVELTLSWLVLAFGAFYAYALAESGPRMYHGNFIWSGQLAVFMLFVAASMIWAREILTRRMEVWMTLVCALALGLHVVGGLRHVLMKMTVQQWVAF